MAIETADQILESKQLEDGKILLIGKNRNRLTMVLCGALADGRPNLNVQTVFAAKVADRVPAGTLRGLFHNTIHSARDFYQMSTATEENLGGVIH